MKTAQIELLVVSSNRDARRLLCQALERGGYRTFCAASPAEAERAIAANARPRLVLLALRGDDPDAALELCRRIHRLVPSPIIVIVDHELREYADWLLEEYVADLIVSPASPEEALMRVRRLLRRPANNHHSEPSDNSPANNGRVKSTLSAGGRTVLLSDREAALFELLQRHANRVLTADYLLTQVWPDARVGEVTLRVTIHRLRQKIERLPGREEHILSVRGRGYMYSAGGSSRPREP